MLESGVLAGEAFEGGLPVKRMEGRDVHDVGDVFECEEPTVRRYAACTHEPVGEALSVTPASFSKILVLEVGFALPGIDHEVPEDIKDAFGDFNRGTVADEFVHGTAFTNDLKKSVDELGIGLHTVDVNDHGFTTDENLYRMDTVGVDGRGVGVNSVGGDGLMVTVDVAGGKRRAGALSRIRSREDMMSILGGMCQRLSHDVGGDVEEEAAKCFIRRVAWSDASAAWKVSVWIGDVSGEAIIKVKHVVEVGLKRS